MLICPSQMAELRGISFQCSFVRLTLSFKGVRVYRGQKQKSRIVKITLEDALGSTVLVAAHLSGRPSNIVFLHTVGRDCVYFTDTR